MTQQHDDIRTFLGIDNTSDRMNVSVPTKAGVYAYALDNVDVDDEGKPHRREGHESALVNGTSVRSLWANKDICLFLDGTTFYRLSKAFVATALIINIPPSEEFAYVDDDRGLVYFGSPHYVGSVNGVLGTSSAFTSPGMTYKGIMVGGQLLEIFDTRLYAANGKFLYYSDPTVPSRRDTRRDAIPYRSRITMLKAVNDGIYVSNSERVFFVSGKDPKDFKTEEVLDVPAIEGMAVTSTDPSRKPSMKTVLFMTESGMYEGFPQGQVVLQQKGLFEFPNATKGCAILRYGRWSQYLGMGWHVVEASPSVSPSASPSASPSS